MVREPRAIVLVLDSVGAGELPDAAEYGDEGSNTLSNTAKAVGGLRMPNLGAMGLGHVTDILGVPPAIAPTASWGKNAEASAGKDTTTGHWEMMGLQLTHAFPTYDKTGFPPDVMDAFTRETGEGWLGNYAASGTEIIQKLGDEHVATGKPIVYTSADSVFQIAAHEGVIPIERLYEICGIARTKVLVGEHAVGRIIARPFIGPVDGVYQRTHRRRDFALEPSEPTVLDRLLEAGISSYGIGKIGEIFAWRGICESPHSENNMHGFDNLLKRVRDEGDNGFVFANLVDFDMVWGHRNDVAGYAGGLEAVDARIPELIDAMVDGDLFIMTADHGCDPTTGSTDHSREYTPLIAKIKGVEKGVPLGIRPTFSDIGETVLDFYGLAGRSGRGASFLSDVRGVR